MSIILGIDPGLRHTGWGIIESVGNNLSFIACGTINPINTDKIEERLLAKLNTAIEPEIKVDAIAVVAMVLSCPAPRPKDLGIISLIVFKTPGSIMLKFGRHLNPECINEGN